LIWSLLLMAKPEIKTSIALKLHAFGLTQLHDPNWTGMEMFDRLRQHTRGRQEPTTMLSKTIPNGLLFHIGLWLLDDYIISDTYRMSLGGEYRLWYLEDLIDLLVSAGAQTNDSLIEKASATVDHINRLYDEDEGRYFEAVDRRVFHDRQLCEHVSRTLVAIGFDGRDDWTGPAKQWVERQDSWPTWAVKAVQARDRGHCAQCDSDLYLGLTDNQDIDHIVPLAAGGTNNLSNLQLLCEPCNLKKGQQLIDVRSSVPPYLLAARKHKVRSKKLSKN
jgi:5-methylcytosine-specific restriction endonuclease McrA